MIELQHLRAFIGIADAGGVTKAAGKLHLSQPAISRQIHALEAALAVPLFERAGRGVRLTPDGEDLLRRSQRVVAEADALVERARAIKAADAGILKIGATPPMIESVLSGFLSGYARRHPAVEVHIVEDGGASLATRLERGDVHLAYVPAPDDRFSGRLLFPIHVVAALPRSSKAGRRGQIEVADLAGVLLLALKEGFGSRAWFDDACRAASVRANIALESASYNAILALARAKYGIGILPSAVAATHPDLKLIPIVSRGVPIGRWTMLAWNRDRYLAPYAAVFADELVAYAQSNYPGRQLVRRAAVIRRPIMPGVLPGLRQNPSPRVRQ